MKHYLLIHMVIIFIMTGCDSGSGIGSGMGSGIASGVGSGVDSGVGSDSNVAAALITATVEGGERVASRDVKTNNSGIEKTDAVSQTEDSKTKNIVSQCDACHSPQGMKNDPNIPNIAGQHPKYMVAALDNYTKGNRHHEVMMRVLSILSDAEVAAVAEYYGSLTTPWQRHRDKKEKSTAVGDKELIAAGEKSSTPCASCHGSDGNSVRNAVPSLAGIQVQYFIKVLNDYFNSHRKDPFMKYFSASLGDKEIRQLAAYYTNLTPRKSSVVVKGNIAAGKAAAATCQGCHGDGGNSINPMIPSIAGQDGEYLSKSLIAYQTGERKDEMMKPAVAAFTKQDIQNLAAYYSTQEPKKVTVGLTSDMSNFDPLSQGKSIAGSCNGCHGNNGNSKTSGIPSLTRFTADYIASAINAYKSGARKNAGMKSMVAFLAPSDIEKVSLYYANQDPEKTSIVVSGDVTAGMNIAEKCVGCHGKGGNSGDSKIPSLAGQDAKYIMNAIAQYKNGKRDYKDMKNAVKELKKEDVVNLAAYYSQQVPIKLAARVLEGPAVLAVKCDRCHGPGGRGDNVNTPIIAGQVKSYITKVLHEYRDGVRKHSTMNAMIESLTTLEIDAIAKHYAQQ